MYEKKRAELMAKAQNLVDSGDFEGFEAVKKEIEALDAEHEKAVNAMADLAALKSENFGTFPMLNSGETAGMAVGISGTLEAANEPDDWRASTEYRLAFMAYSTGAKSTIPDKFRNEAAVTTTEDVGAVIPTTVVSKIIEKMETVGKIWTRMNHTSYKGGVSIPTSSIKPVAKFVAERGTTETQKKTVGYISFGYHKLTCKVAVSFEVSVTTLDIFESKLADNIAKAMVKEIEIEAIKGTGTKMPVGILNEAAPDGQNIDIAAGKDITYKDLAKAEGALPEEYEDGAVWCMTKKTYFESFVGMTTTDGKPVIKEITGPNGKPIYYLLGREVLLLSSEHVSTFKANMEADTVVAFIYDWNDYAGNTNYEMGIREYIDEDTDDRVKKALMLFDGKPADRNSLVTITKKAG